MTSACGECLGDITKGQPIDHMGFSIRHKHRRDCLASKESELAELRERLSYQAKNICDLAIATGKNADQNQRSRDELADLALKFQWANERDFVLRTALEIAASFLAETATHSPDCPGRDLDWAEHVICTCGLKKARQEVNGALVTKSPKDAT